MDTLVDLVLSGKYLAAVGAVLVPVVGALRWFLTQKLKISWLETKVGGYVLAYVVAVASYVGAALQTQDSVDVPRLLLTALTTALLSSGVLDHWRDVVGAVKKSAPMGATISLLLICGATISCAHGSGHTGADIKSAVVACAKQDRTALEAIEREAIKLALVAKDSGWRAVAATAVQDGLLVGGCAFAKVVSEQPVTRVAADAVVETPQSVFEEYRAKYAGGASFSLDP